MQHRTPVARAPAALVSAVSGLALDVRGALHDCAKVALAGDAELALIANRFFGVHDAHLGRLRAALRRFGPGHPPGRTAFAARGSASKDWFAQDEGPALRHVIEGERRLVARYDHALLEASPRPDIHTLLAYQRDALRREIASLDST